MRRIAIVGGGYLGSVTALLFSQNPDYQITLIEKSDRLGGLYNDAWEDGPYHFDFGSRAILATGMEEIDDNLFSLLPEAEYRKSTANLKEFSFQSGTLCEYSNCLDARLLPKDIYAKGLAELMSVSPEHFDGQVFANLAEFSVAHYGQTLTDHLIRPAMEKLTGLPLEAQDPVSLPTHALHRLIMVGRGEAQKLKAENPFNDARIAFTRFDDHASKLTKAYPRTEGLSRFSQRLHQGLLARSNVRVLTNTSVEAIVRTDTRFNTLTLDNGESLSCDEVLWTIPSIFLAKLIGTDLSGLKPTTFRNTVLAHYLIKGEIKTSGYFVYNYDQGFKTYRATFYDNFTQRPEPYKSVTIEMFHDALDPDLEGLRTSLFDELKAMGCIDQNAVIAKSDVQFHRNGWPNFSTDFFSGQAALNERVKGHYENLHFLGKANGRHHTLALIHSAYELFRQFNPVPVSA